MDLIKFNDIKLDDVTICKACASEKINLYLAKILYNNKPLYTDSLKMVVSDMDIDNKKICFQFSTESNDFYKFIINLDDTLKMKLSNESESVLGFKSSQRNINNLFKTTIQIPVNVTDAPYLHFNYDNNIKIYDINGKNILFKDIKSNYETVLSFSIKNIEFYKNKINLSLTLQTIKVLHDIEQSNDYMFRDTESSCSSEKIDSD
jgi:hypothetical protein